MLADPYSKKRPRNYTDDEFQAALALLIDDNEHDHKKRKPEYWSDSDNDDWPKYDHNNEHPYDPTLNLLTPIPRRPNEEAGWWTYRGGLNGVR